jgi:hypothetical protein
LEFTLAGQGEIASGNKRSAVGKIDFPHLPVVSAISKA